MVFVLFYPFRLAPYSDFIKTCTHELEMFIVICKKDTIYENKPLPEPNLLKNKEHELTYIIIYK